MSLELVIYTNISKISYTLFGSWIDLEVQNRAGEKTVKAFYVRNNFKF